MSTFTLPFSGGDTLTLPSGAKFYLLDTTDPVDVDFLSKSGTKLQESAANVEAGFWSAPKGGFGRVQISSATAQTVKVLITRGDAGNNRTIGSVQLLAGTADVGNVGLSDGATLERIERHGPPSTSRIGYAGALMPGTGYGKGGVANLHTTDNLAIRRLLWNSAGAGSLYVLAYDDGSESIKTYKSRSVSGLSISSLMKLYYYNRTTAYTTGEPYPIAAGINEVISLDDEPILLGPGDVMCFYSDVAGDAAIYAEVEQFT